MFTFWSRRKIRTMLSRNLQRECYNLDPVNDAKQRPWPRSMVSTNLGLKVVPINSGGSNLSMVKPALESPARWLL